MIHPGNVDQEAKCQECGEIDILDSTLKICFECWCLLDLRQQEMELAQNEEE